MGVILTFAILLRIGVAVYYGDWLPARQDDNSYRTILGLSTLVKYLWWTMAALLPGSREAGREKRQLHRYLLKRIPSF